MLQERKKGHIHVVMLLNEDLTYTLKLERKVTFHIKLILIPSILLSLMSTVIFWIPSYRPDRTAMGNNFNFMY